MRLSEMFKEFLEDEDTSNTIHNLLHVMQTKGFAVVLLFLLLPTALPIPTGGLTNIFELIALAISVQLMLGKKEFWLPKKVLHFELKLASQPKVVATISQFLEKLEKYAKPRWPQFINNSSVTYISGFFFTLFSLGSIFAPWFTWLDTLPSLGVILLAFALIFEDAVLWWIGVIVGVVGCLIVAIADAAAAKLVWNWFLHLIGTPK